MQVFLAVDCVLFQLPKFKQILWVPLDVSIKTVQNTQAKDNLQQRSSGH